MVGLFYRDVVKKSPYLLQLKIWTNEKNEKRVTRKKVVIFAN